MSSLNSKLYLLYQTVRYNLKIIFANKFIYFLLSALLFFLFIAVVDLFDPSQYPTEEDAFYLLLLPGILLIFYPSVYGIQNDADNRTLELLFGIPDYRYKVWLVRFVLTFVLVYIILVLMCLLSIVVFARVEVFEMAGELMYPIAFVGALGFMFSTLIRSGNGTAAMMVLVMFIVWITSLIWEDTVWSVFLNPYDMPREYNYVIWQETIFYNRLYLVVATILAILAALFRLQRREKFI